MNRYLKRSLLILLAYLLVGCGERSANEAPGQSSTEVLVSGSGEQSATQAGEISATGGGPSSLVDRGVPGDLETIIARGELRILTKRGETSLPASHPLEQERLLLERFARALGVRAKFRSVDTYSELYAHLHSGGGDLIAANLPVSDTLDAEFTFSLPISHRTLVLVGRQDQAVISDPTDLAGRQLSLARDSGYWPLANHLYDQQPLLELVVLPGNSTPEQNLERLLAGELEMTLVDASLLSSNPSWESRLKVLYTLEAEQPSAVALRKESPELLQAFNRYLTQQRLTLGEHDVAFGDLEAIRERGVLRILTRNNSSNYFLWRGRQLGFEFELAQRFASREKLDLEVVVVPNHAALLPMLLAGKGDIAVGFLSRDERFHGQGIDYSEPYHYATAMLVGRADEEPSVESLEQLAGRTVMVRISSRHWRLLEPLARKYGFSLEAAPESMEDEDLIGAVASGRFDLSVVDNHLLKQQRHLRDDIQGLFPVGEMAAHRWAVRSASVELLAAIDRYHTTNYKKAFYNTLIGKYFNSPQRILAHFEERIDGGEAARFSSYDEQIKAQAERYGFDWRLMVAQIYQESRFNPVARSHAGAQGLMQIMPDTAKQVGVKDPDDPQDSIRGGIKYLAWLRDKFDESLSIEDRTWFALASYNAGLGHVLDARRLATELGLDPNRWFDNVEKAMLLLSERKYAKKARYGYVRGQEPVNYVREIRNRYKAYTLLTAWNHPSNG